MRKVGLASFMTSTLTPLRRYVAAGVGMAVIAAGLVVSAAQPAAAAPAPGQGRWAAMAPLDLDYTGNRNGVLESSELTTFGAHLDSIKPIGVQAITVDVWWGKTEPTNNAYNWQYYDTIFSFIKSKGFKIVPIFSFHQCGGNVGDVCDVPVPSWVWGLGSAESLKYKSETGNFSNEYVSHWGYTNVAAVRTQYAEWVQAFAARYGTTYANDFIEINVSMGPAGELRYPSYNQHDSANFRAQYPNRGTMQGYSTAARSDFRTFVLGRYGTLAAINAAWGSSLTSTSQINPPDNPDYFFGNQEYRTTRYGRDLVDWYAQSLANYGKRFLSDVSCGLGTAFPAADLGYKIPGIHWRIATEGNSMPRSAEVTAGLIKTSELTQNQGYGAIVSVGNAPLACGSSRDTVLHFTALELANGRDGVAAASRAEDLVRWVGAAAAAQGVTIKGENALAAEVGSNGGWDRIDAAFRDTGYSGLTVLRAEQVASGTGRERYRQLIARYGVPTLHVPGNHNGWATNGTPLTRGSDGIWRGTFTSGPPPAAVKFNVRPTDWAQNYGGSSASGTAVPNGGNIPLDPSTRYSVTFNDSTLQYTFTRTS